MNSNSLSKENIFLFTSDKIFNGEYNEILAFIEKNFSIGMHRQEFYEINIVLGSDGIHYIGDYKYPVSRGNTFIVPPLVEHGYIADDDFEVFHLLISPKFLTKNIAILQSIPTFSILFRIEPLFRLSGADPIFLKLSEDELKDLNLNDLIKHSYSTSVEENIILNSKTNIFLVGLCRLYSKQFPAINVPDADLMASIARIYKDFDKKITVDELARQAHLARTTYFKRFMEITGTTPLKFINSVRLDMAKNMLLTSSLPLSVIAEKTGFYDLSHFVRSYKSKFGNKPKR